LCASAVWGGLPRWDPGGSHCDKHLTSTTHIGAAGTPVLPARSAAHAEAELATAVPMLPPPNHAVGAAAAVLTRLLYAGAAGAVFLSIQDAQDACECSRR
jgi:hypothetical protein